MIKLRETIVFPFETWELYSIAVVHKASRPERIGDSARSKVTNRPNPSEVLGSQIDLDPWARKFRRNLNQISLILIIKNESNNNWWFSL